MIEILLFAFLIIVITFAIIAVIGLIKNEFTYRNHMKICDAIFAYNMYLIEEGRYDPSNQVVTFDDMEDYDVTQRRFWDWGYTRILPPEKFELIKGFIKR